eukprot:scaffold3720_cov401-Prasinococcus_capsulatus_cf.AAC.13
MGCAQFVVLFMSSTAMFYIENPHQPDEFDSVLSSMWWGINCITSVGYGDIVPMTAFGRAIAAVTSVVGLLLLALVASILSSGFYQVLMVGHGTGYADCTSLRDLVRGAGESSPDHRAQWEAQMNDCSTRRRSALSLVANLDLADATHGKQDGPHRGGAAGAQGASVQRPEPRSQSCTIVQLKEVPLVLRDASFSPYSTADAAAT